MRVDFTLNGASRSLDTPPLTRLLDALRGLLGLTGTKEGCGEGECGSCTVLLDGEPVNACLVAVGQCEGRNVTTVEGLAEGGLLTPLQDAFVTEGGAQCGICRCTGYQRIVESIRTAARARKPSDLFRNVPPAPPSSEVL